MKKLFPFLALVLALVFQSAFASEQSIPNGINRIGATPNGVDYSNINVAVVDTGVQFDHPDLNVVGGVDCTASSVSFLGNGEYTVQGQGPFSPIFRKNAPGWDDGYGHGTHVAGIIGAKDNNLGVVGVAPNASIWSVRVLNSMGFGTEESILCGLDWIIEYHDKIDAVNMSLGGTQDAYLPDMLASCNFREPYVPTRLDKSKDSGLMTDVPLHERMCKILDLGIPIVVAAGNSDKDAGFNYPAGFKEVITVSNFADFDGLPGGLGENTACPRYGGWDDTLWVHKNNTPMKDFSSSNGEVVDFAAPGTCVFSTIPTVFGPGYGYATGTSMAAPHVAGAVVRILHDLQPLDRNRETVNLVVDILQANAEEQTASFHDVDKFHEPLIHVIN